MDKQTAIDLLDNLLGMVEDNHESDYDTAIKMGIDALKMQLSIESTTFPVEGTTLDCISRQQAILCIERNAYRREDINETEKVILWVLDIIKWLPSVQPQRWIPVAEALPERGKEVLVTRDYSGRKDHNKSCRYVETASRYGEDEDVVWSSYSDEYKMHPKSHRVVAWMPLPPVYEGRHDGTT